VATIWKFPLLLSGWNDIRVGADGDGVTQVVLTAPDPATGNPAIWIAHDPEGAPMLRSFLIVGTGHTIPSGDDIEPVEHVGSMIAGAFVWHVYERTLTMGEAWKALA
jgi:hypothetical protein